MTFSERLNRLMEEHKVTAYKLWKETGLPQAVISRYKKGDNVPSVDKAQVIADYFDISVDYLLGRTEDPHGHERIIVMREGEDDFSDATPEERKALRAFLETYRSQMKK